MQRLAVVTEVKGEAAVVEVSRSSACEGCASRESCHACIALSDNRAMRSKALNEVGAEIGDRVMIETESKTVLAYAAAVFLFPLVLAVIGYAIGTLVFSRLSAIAALPAGNILPILCALVGFVIAFLLLFFVLDKRAAKRYDVRIVRIIKGDSESSDTAV